MLPANRTNTNLATDGNRPYCDHSVSIKSLKGGPCSVKYGDKWIELETVAGQEYRFAGLRDVPFGVTWRAVLLANMEPGAIGGSGAPWVVDQGLVLVTHAASPPILFEFLASVSPTEPGLLSYGLRRQATCANRVPKRCQPPKCTPVHHVSGKLRQNLRSASRITARPQTLARVFQV